MYEIIFSRKSAKFISEIPESYKDKIKEILEVLKQNPMGVLIRRLKVKQISIGFVWENIAFYMK